MENGEAAPSKISTKEGEPNKWFYICEVDIMLLLVLVFFLSLVIFIQIQQNGAIDLFKSSEMAK